jgi:hypothetical protein
VRPLITFDTRKHAQVEAALAAASRPLLSLVLVAGAGTDAGGAERPARVELSERNPGRGAAGKCGVTGREFQVKR